LYIITYAPPVPLAQGPELMKRKQNVVLEQRKRKSEGLQVLTFFSLARSLVREKKRGREVIGLARIEWGYKGRKSRE